MSDKHKTEDQYEMVPLSQKKLDEALKQSPEWQKVSEQWIAREYKFDNYLDGVYFAKEIGEYAEERQHHPSIKIDYKKVTIKISSWRAKGITELDIEMIKDFDSIYEQ
ncbi:4a-hydroxytetrahydrobiopterin dehydratase [Lentibacillus sp. JNUCC-1]|uniref:4a-hydroxytetrahydrobiopterin dehydratase n=1 Tax=Lentibacillus sp. JNUCC-1 TaxID=2654513 RepID=UPI001327E0E9|nr:4a-hydroxytetrahydrobiopterin dehydratase [Lentibacillus sp. JNUCC-1]MUV37708.1 4a-hydroxytetrahydrobiopterin dehydratase [Lentibacillus sp. JNUCC-1]